MGKFRGLKSKWAKLYFAEIESSSSAETRPHKCLRCGVVLCLSNDKQTGRLDYTPCIRHLVGEELGAKRQRESDSVDSKSETTCGTCSEGVLAYDAEAAWYAVRDAEKSADCTKSVHVGLESKRDAELAIRDCAARLCALARAVKVRRTSNTDAHGPPVSIIGLLNPKTPANYGAILRACGCFARSLGEPSTLDCAVVYSDGRLQRAMAHQEDAFSRELGCSSGGNRAQKGVSIANTDTMAAGLRIPQWHLQRHHDFEHLIDAVRASTKDDASNSAPNILFVAVDLIEGAVSLPLFSHFLEKETPPDAVVYLFGPEDGSIPSSIVSKCDRAVFIKTDGSLNLSATVNVLLYDRLCKWEQRTQVPHGEEGDSYKVNRNSNNKTRVRLESPQ